MRKLLVALLVVVTVLTGCSAGSEAQAKLKAGAVPIDVRTPEEFAGGHLDGALNIDIYKPDFATRIAELPKDSSYVVYCRSGNRSAQAVRVMEGLGFTDVTDGGAYADLR